MEELLRFGIDEEEIHAWIRAVAGEPQAPWILNDKGWSIVAHFGPAVLKVTAGGKYPDGACMFELVGRAAPGLVPDLVAYRVGEDGRQEMLFRPFEGVPVEKLALAERRGGFVQLARTFGAVQTGLPGIDRSGLTAVPAAAVPGFFDELIDGAVSRCQSEYPDQWCAECARQNLPTDFGVSLLSWREAISEWAAKLERGGWSKGIDHVDLLPHNANRLPDGGCILYDWEQATIGVSFFSLDVLLAYAQCLDEGENGLVLRPERISPTQTLIRDAYLAAHPGPLDLALRLSPIRYCWAEWNQACALGVPQYGVDDVVWWLSRALRRWERAAS